MTSFINWAIGITIVIVITSTILRPYDDTDDHINGKRSMMELLTDHGTGCQYLVARGLFGVSITPRMDAEGNHVCD